MSNPELHAAAGRARGIGALAGLWSVVLCGACVPIGDPEGPGAAGTVRLAGKQTPSDYAYLRFEASPASQAFDPKAPVFPAPDGPSQHWHTDWVDLTTAEFPLTYQFGEVVGTTPHRRWRIYAWLAKDSEEARPGKGAPYGTREFSLEDCGVYDDYCEVTGGVDLVLDQTMP